MGIELNINYILRSDSFNDVRLEKAKEYLFEKPGLHHLADTLPIWLTQKDWTVLADIQITSQTRTANKTSGTFIITHIYENEEQIILTDIFRRMYGW